MTARADQVVVERLVVSAHHVAALHRDESTRLSPRAVARRRAEFATGRACARRAVTRLLGPGTGPLVVLRSETGAPAACRLPTLAPTAAYVSITHADGLAMAAASEVAVGIDLVSVEDHGPAFADEVFAAGELPAWETWLGERGVRAASVAFAAKEAAYKCLQGKGLPAVRVEPVEGGREPRGLPATRAFNATVELTAAPRQVDIQGWVTPVDRRQVAVILTVAR